MVMRSKLRWRPAGNLLENSRKMAWADESDKPCGFSDDIEGFCPTMLVIY